MDQIRDIFTRTYIKPEVDLTDYKGDDQTMFMLLSYFQRLNYQDVTIYCHHKSFFITWNAYFSHFEMSSQLQKDIEACSTRYFIVLLYLAYPNFETPTVRRHANLLIFNRQDQTLQRFDPHGKTTPQRYNP